MSELQPNGEPELNATRKCCVLLVHEDPVIRSALWAFLSLHSDEFKILTADAPEAAQLVFSEHEIDIVVTDAGEKSVQAPSTPAMGGVALLAWVREYHPH